MAGIYIHIPFCRQACHYCNFHFSTSLRYRAEMVAMLDKELQLRSDYLGGEQVDTVYWGGGTPSLLTATELGQLWATIGRHYRLGGDLEITLEANPDDLTEDYLQRLRDQTPVNRLSIGIQSFWEEDLRWMNRAHHAGQARQCITDALRMGFEWLTVDLIYGSPTLTDTRWADNLRLVADYGIPHFSAYALTVEAKTALAHFVEKGKCVPPEEEQTARQFEMLVAWAPEHGYEQYEISNFCVPPRYARHNSSYWQGKPYIGIGPSAHSFDGKSRQWNVPNNQQYLKAIAAGTIPCEIEILSPAQQYNEYLMTGLRTRWGVTTERMGGRGNTFEQQAARYIASGHLERVGAVYRLTDKGKLISDAILVDLFVEEDN